ncbi:MAG: hypothetical protein ACYCXN_04170 [Acidimicrobiales bacterium]|jgi:hypothetical protein
MARPTGAGLSVEVDRGSATSWDRPPDLAWLVRLRRGGAQVVVAWGLSHASAERLAQKVTDVLCGCCCCVCCRDGRGER